MKMIENIPKIHKRKYDTETTNYKVAKDIANKIMLNNSHVAEIYLGCLQKTGNWAIVLQTYSKEFVEKYSK